MTIARTPRTALLGWGFIGYATWSLAFTIAIFVATAAAIYVLDAAAFAATAGTLGIALVVVVAVMATYLVAGAGLLTGQKWARPLALGAALLTLGNWPGVLLGAATFWTFAQEAAATRTDNV